MKGSIKTTMKVPQLSLAVSRWRESSKERIQNERKRLYN